MKGLKKMEREVLGKTPDCGIRNADCGMKDKVAE
jgi:hypothetical protein